MIELPQYDSSKEGEDDNPDSGWRFMAGDEDDDYMNNPVCEQNISL